MSITTQQDFDVKLQALIDAYKTHSANIATLIKDVTTAFNTLQQKIAVLQAQIGGQTTVDLSPELNQINTLLTSVASDNAAIASADTAAQVEGQ